MKLAFTTKITMILLSSYAFGLTIVILLAVSFGPLQESTQLWAKARILETELRESLKETEKLILEKNRLLETVKQLQTDWTSGRETIRTLRTLVDNPESEQKLLEANKLAEKLSQERGVLIAKLNELRKEIEACSKNKSSAQDKEP